MKFPEQWLSDSAFYLFPEIPAQGGTMVLVYIQLSQVPQNGYRQDFWRLIIF